MKNSLDILIINDMVLFPKSEIRVEFDNTTPTPFDKFYNAEHQLIVVVNPLNNDLPTDVMNLPKVGVLSEIKLVMDVPNGKTRIVLEGIERVMIESYNDIIVSVAATYNIDPNLMRAIIYEEQTHNKTPDMEGAPFINSIGPMAVNKKHWGELTRSQMLDPNTNILVGANVLSQSIKRVGENGQNSSVAQIASNYNNENAITVTTDYGTRVERFYIWFTENYVER